MTMIANCLTLFFLLAVINKTASQGCKTDNEILAAILGDYNKSKLPEGIPIEVEVEMWLQDVHDQDDVTNQVKLDLYINHKWVDPALSYADLNPCSKNITFNEPTLAKLWTPNLNMINSKRFEVHESPVKNVFSLIYPNGKLWSNRRTRVTVPCDTNWMKFPFDTQVCKLLYQSYIYGANKVMVNWSNATVMQLLPFTGMAWHSLDTIEQDFSMNEYPAGMWPELSLIFKFSRSCGWYFLMVYFPTLFVVLLALVGVTLGIRAVPFRAVLSVASLLAYLVHMGTVMRSIPQAQTVKAIDIWLFVCLVFILVAIGELMYIAWLTWKLGETETETKDAQKGRKIDKLFLVAYPAAFVVFNIIYWLVVLLA